VATFPELRYLMAKHGMTQDKMSAIIGNTPLTFSRKINFQSEFTWDDIVSIKEFFENLGESITVDDLFFTWSFTKVKNKKEAAL
jgi:DNA-binding XRE family transcriptional regulator